MRFDCETGLGAHPKTQLCDTSSNEWREYQGDTESNGP